MGWLLGPLHTEVPFPRPAEPSPGTAPAAGMGWPQVPLRTAAGFVVGILFLHRYAEFVMDL